MYISINGQLIPLKQASINLDSEGFIYGYGLFETIKFQENRIHYFQEHLERMKISLKKINMSLEIEDPVVEQYCQELIKANQLSSGVLRITCVKEKEKTRLIVSTRENHYKKEDSQRGFRITFTDAKRNPYALLTYIKSNNYMENHLVRQQALAQGYQEAVYVNIYDKLCEGSLSNIFFVKGDTIFTPSISCGLLPGIMRQRIIELIKALKLNIEIGEYTKQDLMMAEEVFVTNSLLEIMPVAEIDGKKLDLNANTITQELIKQYGDDKARIQ
ncbi:4-amino-4-deoxychorismate lyase [Natronincola peptidivorans]|uniref:4-amino-4-deoxychorismate lyase n=1 Tax=Natronincola peptidivorans TaxID=426128 RepID=A0A1I0DP78_9FIRM|nr:aminotransferase class IV [Natronincola peptidivorans]SET33688.1 4-amino-4-deoxychorismate lyase [Natronincola peptidivorans]